MPNNERSKHVTQGVARSANRAMYYAMGYKDEDFDKPMIGVANGHSTITPCNAGLQKLADAAIAAIEKCGRECAGVRHADGVGRDQHGHRRHEVFAGIARSHRRFDRNLRARPVDGRRARDRRLRQEHAGRRDGDRALQRARDLRLWRHRETGSLQRQGPHDRVVVRSSRRIHRRPLESKRISRKSSAAACRVRARAAACTPPTR